MASLTNISDRADWQAIILLECLAWMVIYFQRGKRWGLFFQAVNGSVNLNSAGNKSSSLSAPIGSNAWFIQQAKAIPGDILKLSTGGA